MCNVRGGGSGNLILGEGLLRGLGSKVLELRLRATDAKRVRFHVEPLVHSFLGAGEWILPVLRHPKP